MDWFKHYSDAGEGKFLNHLMDEFGVQAYAWYFLLVELCAKKWDGRSDPYFTFHQRTIRQKLRISLVKVQLFLDQCQVLGQLSYNFHEKEFHLEVPKLLKIKSSRSVVKNSKGPIKKRIEENRREKNIITSELENSSSRGCISELLGDDDVENFLKSVSSSAQKLWIKQYSASWVSSEILKAIAWLEVNPKRRPKNNGKFMGNWLSRGYESYRKTIPAQRAVPGQFTQKAKKYPDCPMCANVGIINKDNGTGEICSYRCDCERGSDNYPNLARLIKN